LHRKLVAVSLVCSVLGQPLLAESPALPGGILASARSGFSPAEAADFRNRFSSPEIISAGDVALFHFLHPGLWLKGMIVGRSGNFVDLPEEPDATIGQIRYTDGAPTLDDYLVSETSRAQGFIVLRGGKIVYESYPGMRPSDVHVWMSISKTAPALIVRLLADEGKINVEDPVDTYIVALHNTAWAGVRVRDVLDMASGLDIGETQAAREDPKSIVSRFNLSVTGEPDADGRVENQLDVIRSAKTLRPAGEAFDYSSLNTTVLALLAEAVENKRFAQIFEERVWSRMTVEADMHLAVSPDGVPQAHGFFSSRLRDLARYGLLYTPSWANAARERIVSPDYVRAIQTEGRKSIFLAGELGNRLTNNSFSIDPPTANAWQWDAVWDDGDFYKGGVYGQGLYVSPSRDLVIAFYSTVMSTELTQYARRIALETPPVP
jgi:CubicO group peptidase (beta-lactamase class C family)